MRSRRLLVVGFFIFAGVVSAWHLYKPATPNGLSVRQRLSPQSTLPKVAASAPGSLNFSETVVNNSLYLFRLLTADKELIVYAGAAVFGLFMMVLAFNSANPVNKPSSDAMLQLLKEEKEKAENLARLKAEFLNQVSHELRTPLAVIIGYLECLTDGLYGKVDHKHQDILQIVAAQSGHLKNMIDQILIYSRLEASKQPVRIEEFSPPKVLLDLRDTFEFLCIQKDLQLKWELPRKAPSIKNDPEKFKEVASNLLQNAIKYTDAGSITVSISEVEPSRSVVLEVSDTGIGIPQNALGNIFEPFIQVHKTSTENSRGGIGLGLSIVKKNLEQMNGTISVQSELGKGTKFTVVFPRYFKYRGKAKFAFLRRISVPFLWPKPGGAVIGDRSIRRARPEPQTGNFV